MNKLILFLIVISSLIFAQEESDYYYYNKVPVSSTPVLSYTPDQQDDSLMFWFASESIWTTGFWADTADNYSNDDNVVQIGYGNLDGISTSANLNGKRFLRSDGSGGFLAWSTNAEMFNWTNWTIYVVDSGKTTTNYGHIVSAQGNAGANEIVFNRFDNSNKLNMLARDANGVILINKVGDSTVAGKWAIMVFQLSTVTRTARFISSGDTSQIVGGSSAFLTSTKYFNGTNPGVMGVVYSGSPNGLQDGGIAEILVYRGYHDLTMVNKVAGYLSDKYRLVWNTNFQ